MGETERVPQTAAALVAEFFGTAAAHGALYEIELRIIAAKFSRTIDRALDSKLESVEEAVFALFANHLSSDETAFLRATRQLRNKLLHGELDVAVSKLEALGFVAKTDGMFHLNLETNTTTEMADVPTKEALYGWYLLGGRRDGLFQRAAEAFKKARGILLRLAQIHEP